MLDLGTLQLGIKVNDEGAKAELNQLGNEVDKTGQKTDSLASKAKTMIKAFVAAYAIKEIVKLGKAALDAYAEFQQLEGGVNKIFGKEAAKEVMANANKAYKTAGMSANEYMETVTNFSASLISSMEGDTKAAAKVADMAVRDMSDNANTFGTNIKSIQDAYQGFAKQNYTMLDNLKLGYGGSRGEMERLLKDAEKLTGKKYDISNLDDVYEAIHVIQKEYKITGTTAKEASKTIQGSLNQTKASFTNLLTAIGSGKGVSKAVQQFLDSIETAAKNILPVLIDIVKGLVVGVAKAIPGLMLKIADAISKFADTIGSKSSNKYIKAGIKIIGALVKGILQATPQIIAALGKLAASIVKKIGSINLRSVGVTIIKSLLNGFKAAWGALSNWVDSKVSAIKSKFSSAKSAAKVGHRIGLREVPYDGYAAELHQGEVILTAAEANQYKKHMENLNSMASGVVNGIASANMLSNTGTTEATIVINLGGAKVAEQVFRLNKQGKLAFTG